MARDSTESQSNERQLETVRRLISEFSSSDILVRKKARLALEKIGDLAVEPLIQAIKGPDHRINVSAIKTLAEMRKPAAAQLLVDSLDSNDRDVRWIAAEGLIALGQDGLEPLLNALINNPKSAWLLQGAHHVLYDLYAGHVHEGESDYKPRQGLDEALRFKIKPVLTALEDIDPYLRLTLTSQSALLALRGREKES